jgi:hypothetical protein
MECYTTETENDIAGNFSHKARVLSIRSTASATDFFQKT